MEIYTKEEIDDINELISKNKELQDGLENNKKLILEEVTPLFSVLAIDFSDVSSVKKILDSQSLMLTIKLRLTDQINSYLSKRSKISSTLKKLKQQKFLFYATGFAVKTNLGEKSILIDGHLADHQRRLDLVENYIDFLRDVIKTLDSFGYSIKNTIDLMNYLGK
jgi:hypothetical protein